MCGHSKDKSVIKLIKSLPPIYIIECGALHSACIDTDGNLYTWGSN